VTFVYGLIRAGETSWSDTGVITCIVAGVLLLVAFGVTEARVAHPMFDLGLFRVPTFAGGSIAAFAMNGSLYAVLLYFVIYLQDVLGYSALGTGLRVAILSLAQLATSVVAGRVSERVPARWLIGPGLLLVGIGLLVMTGISGVSNWTHLVPGFIVAGLGAGLVNPPLASTAIGVVPPAKAGMASGVNSTFRQIGIAAGIAALGSIFVSSIQSHLSSALPASLAGSAGTMVNAVRQGSVSAAIGSLPGADRAAAGLALRSSFASALNELLYVTAGVALVGAVCATVLIRRKDFHRPDAAAVPAGAGRAAETVLGDCVTVVRGRPGTLADPARVFRGVCRRTLRCALRAVIRRLEPGR
jgi:Major Facilitator Superfamily